MIQQIVAGLLIGTAFAGLVEWGRHTDAQESAPKLLADLYYPIDSPLALQIHDFLLLNPAIKYKIRTMGPLEGKLFSLRTIDDARIDGEQKVFQWLWDETKYLTQASPARPYSFNSLPFTINA